MFEPGVSRGCSFSLFGRHWRGGGGLKLSGSSRCRYFTIEAQHHLRFAAFQGDLRSRRDRLHKRDGSGRPELFCGYPGQVTAKGDSGNPLAAYVDDELI